MRGTFSSLVSVRCRSFRNHESLKQRLVPLTPTAFLHSKRRIPEKSSVIQGSSPISWHHHGWSESVLHGVVPAHRKPRTIGDWFAWKLVRLCRYGMDLATGMKNDQRHDTDQEPAKHHAHKPLTEDQWLKRFIFLESIAGVPGMVAGTLRHLQSIRRLQRDNGWTTTLIEESYNERMHLLSFVTIYKPGWFMKLMIFGAQGVFFNAMFVSYLISPKICHRFVGYLEEEAVWTYTHCLREIDDGFLQGWTTQDFKIPDIAVKYWKMPEGRRSMRDLILYIRADEAAHRGVNHTLGNLDQEGDANPFVGARADDDRKPLAALRPMGLERGQVIGGVEGQASIKV